MRGETSRQAEMLLGVTPEQLIPEQHPIRRIKVIVEDVLRAMSPAFDQMYARLGRPSIPPEQLLKSTLLIALYSIRSERQFCERLRYDLLFKWFLDLNISDPAFDPSSFSKNRQRLLEHDIATAFLVAVVDEARRRKLLSEEHFTVDGTLLEAWASHKSYRPRDEDGPPGKGGGRNPEVDFHGERRKRETHQSTTDPDALLYKKSRGGEAKLSYMGHVLMENRNGLVVDVELTQATGTAEREAAVAMLERCQRNGRASLGADKGYDTQDFVAACRQREVTPHVAQNSNGRRSAIDGRTTRHPGYGVSQRLRKRVEEIFGWLKTIAGGRKLHYIGTERNRMWACFAFAAYNILRIAKLEEPAAA